MADVVTVVKQQESNYSAVFKLTNVSDGTGETNVTKIDISEDLADYTAGVSLIRIDKVLWSVSSGAVQLIWGGATPAPALVLSGNGSWFLDLSMASPINNNAVTPTGDLLLSTVNFVATSTYTVMVAIKKINFNGA